MRLTTDLPADVWADCAARAAEEGVSLAAWARSVLTRASPSPKIPSADWAACAAWMESAGLTIPEGMTKKSTVMAWARQMGWDG